VKRIFRILAIVIAFAVSAPMLLFALYDSFVSLLNMALSGGLNMSTWTLVQGPVMLLLWWIGLFGALWLCILISTRETSRGPLAAAVMIFCIGLVSVAMIEYKDLRAPSAALRYFPIGLEIVPYLSLLVLGAALRIT
jgi:hypothetical protein